MVGDKGGAAGESSDVLGGDDESPRSKTEGGGGPVKLASAAHCLQYRLIYVHA